VKRSKEEKRAHPQNLASAALRMVKMVVEDVQTRI
jgi:hypothetical protein